MNRSMLPVITVMALVGVSAHANFQRHEENLQVLQSQAGFEQCKGTEQFPEQGQVTQRFECGTAQEQQGWIDYSYQVDQAGQAGAPVEAKIYKKGVEAPVVVQLGQAPAQQSPAQQSKVTPVHQEEKPPVVQQEQKAPVEQAKAPKKKGCKLFRHFHHGHGDGGKIGKAPTSY